MKIFTRFCRKSKCVLRLLPMIILINNLWISSAMAQNGPYTIFQPSDEPANPAVTDNTGIEVGTKFQTSVNGFITGLRFYKGAANTGTHIGHLWSSTGTLLAEATFTNETTSGWQEVTLGSPVAVSAATTYIVSYHSPGYFAFNSNYFTSAVVNDPLRALADGEDGHNGVYIYSASSAFPNSDGHGSNYWADIVFNTSIDDNTPPTITDISATPNMDGTATIAWTTDEASDSKVDYGTTESSLDLSTSNGSFVTNHTVTLSGLTNGATYYFRVTSADASTNSATKPVSENPPLSFVMPNVCASDQNDADFSSGTLTNTYISMMQDGEVILQPTRAAEFSVLPPVSEWSSFQWTGGTSTVSAGVLTVDGARFNTEPELLPFVPGTSVEFVATFAAVPFQHIGFGGGTDATGSGGIYNGQDPWAMFSTGNSGTALQARIYDGSTFVDFTIPGSFLDVPHRYRIEWTSTQFNFFIDGLLVHTESVAITSSMRVAISDYDNDGQGVSVDWIHVSPYTTSGTFISRIFGGITKTAWGTVAIEADIPDGTTLTIDISTGNTPSPDNTWTNFTPVSNGDDIAFASKYIQYRANLETTDETITPVLRGFSINDCSNCTVQVAISSQSNVSCHGKKDGSIAVSASNGTAPYQYKKGKNGTYQSNPTFTNLKAGLIRIFVTDANGCTVSVKVTLTEPTAVTVGITNQTNVSNHGGHDGSVTVAASGGTGGSYQYKKNGNGTYQTSPTFSGLKANTYKIYAKDVNGCTGFVTVTITEPPTVALNGVDNSNNNYLNDKFNASDLNIEVLPNPSATDFTLVINGNSEEAVEIRVLNMFGKNVYKTSGSIAKSYHFGHELPAGVYMLEVIQGSKLKTVKIIKQ